MKSASGLMHQRAYVWGEDGTRYITHQLDAVFEVKRIVDMMGKLISSKGPVFRCYRRAGNDFVERTRIGDALVLCLKSDLKMIDEQFPQHRHSPLFTLFKQVFGEIHLVGQRLWPEDIAALNAAIAEARACGKGKELRTHLKDMKRSERSNSTACETLLDGLRRRYSKLLVLRVDFEYFSTYCPGVGFRGQVMTLDEAKAHRDKLLKYLRKGPYGKHLAGYMWKMEYGFEKGYHFHVAIFFDGQRVAKDIVLADVLGKYWKNEVTEGKGMYFNCNKCKEDYERCGIGMVNRRDDVKWSYLEEAMRYLTKVDLYLRFQAGKRTRTFATSNASTGRTNAPPQAPVPSIGMQLRPAI